VSSGQESQGILGQAKQPSGSPSALLTGLGPLQLLPLAQVEDHPEREMIFQGNAEIQLAT